MSTTSTFYTVSEIKKAYQHALQVQDACNPSGIVRSWVNVIDAATAELTMIEKSGTKRMRFHPAVVLFASKMHDLCGLGLSNSEAYGRAYNFATRVASGNLVVGSEDHIDALDDYYAQAEGAYCCTQVGGV